jgi:hypothetical protein
MLAADADLFIFDQLGAHDRQALQDFHVPAGWDALADIAPPAGEAADGSGRVVGGAAVAFQVHG